MDAPRKIHRRHLSDVSISLVAIFLCLSPLAHSEQVAAIHTTDIMVKPSTACLELYPVFLWRE